MRTVLLASCLAAGGCRLGDPDAPYVIPGPTAPSMTVTALPHVWDTREELESWINNKVSRGPVSIHGEGRAAVIRIAVAVGDPAPHWVLRGPDFQPPVTGVHSIRLQYRCAPPAIAPQILVWGTLNALFEVVDFPIEIGQARSYVDITCGESAEVILKPSNYRQPLDVRYAYLHSSDSNRGVLEIDSIALVPANGCPAAYFPYEKARCAP
jgi:hypothetical protein